MSNTQHAPFASPYSYSPPAAITDPNNLACKIVSEGGTDFYTVVVPAPGTFDAGANPMTLTTIYPGLLAKIVNNQATDFLVKGSKTGDPGVLCLAGATTVVTDDGKGNLMEVANSRGTLDVPALTTAALARGQVDTNVADLAAFTCSGAGRDGITYVQGDIVVLGAQANSHENGPYTVGAVVANVAPLTRPSWWPTGSKIPPGFFFQLSEDGTLYGGMVLSAQVATGKIVDTDDPVLRMTKAGARYDTAGATVWQKGITCVRNGAGDYSYTAGAGVDFTRAAVVFTPLLVLGFLDIIALSATTLRINFFATDHVTATDAALLVSVNQFGP